MKSSSERVRIALASDHRGVSLKRVLIRALENAGYEVRNVGADREEPCDYPDYGLQAALAVGRGECARAVVICQSGIGMSIVANKVRGVRASLCRSVEDAEAARKHNDANVLALGAANSDPETAAKICIRWLQTEFEGGRHERRVQKIRQYEQDEAARFSS